MSLDNDVHVEPPGRELLVEYLRKSWLGPRGGEHEILPRSPIYTYLIGTLYPVEIGAADAQPRISDEELGPEADLSTSGDEQPASVDPGSLDTNVGDPDEDEGLNLSGAFGWAPQSMGLSFIHDGSVHVTVKAGVYEKASGDDAPKAGTISVGEANDDEMTPEEAWQRRSVSEVVAVPAGRTGKIAVLQGRGSVSWRSREVGGLTLTTVAVSNAATTDPGHAKADAATCLFQVELFVEVVGGTLHPYPGGNPVNASGEDLELELRYRDKAVHAIGHGVAVDWDTDKAPTRAWTECMPSEVVPAVRARESKLDALSLEWLADEKRSAGDLADGLRGFLKGYGIWVAEQASTVAKLPARFVPTAETIVGRAEIALARMHDGIDLLEAGGNVLIAFRLANLAMRTQMMQQRLAQRNPGEIGVPLPELPNEAEDDPGPRWHPFQLGFILISLRSTIDPDHSDRELVDLIWFPTGGGKTEAYLGLAAIEMIRRRLDRGVNGGGTAVITRYTMRLLTAQQFQRAATLMCALELVRKTDHRLANSLPFTIGLWLGNTTTPGTYEQAAGSMKRVYKEASPSNPFQIRQCSWCGTPIMPRRKTTHQQNYGIRATKFSFEVFCPHPECKFHGLLPVQVVDEAIFDDPPTMLVATVDKFARLAWTERGQSLFGLGGSVCDPPSLVIQDELHLISGPLGTIVGLYEAAIRSLIAWTGRPAKVIASTATTRASADQIRELMASKVEIFPPSGLSADENYFSEPDPDRPGRMYVGVMPQAHTPSWAIGQLSTELLQAPVEVGLSGTDRDGYWTLVVYHNSLRELGRTVTILRDDVHTSLERRQLLAKNRSIRQLTKDGVEELNGNVSADELLRILDQLSIGPDDSGQALDALATTNIMSVGIDVSRLGLMLVNGHPKSTSEYIQATSRVGRGATPGLVVTMFRSGKPRDRSVFESFTAYHRAFYRFVEPGSVTPWSVQARRRALRAAFVILMRHAGGLPGNDHAARFDPESVSVAKALQLLGDHVAIADPREAVAVQQELRQVVDDWVRRNEKVSQSGFILKFQSRVAEERLLKQFTDAGPGWPTMNSMRSVDRVVRVRANGER